MKWYKSTPLSCNHSTMKAITSFYTLTVAAAITLTSCDSSNEGNSGLFGSNERKTIAMNTIDGSNETIEFINMTEPKENAFSIDMPKGWNNMIGLERVGNETRNCGVSVSPDNKARIFFGDPSIPAFTKPIPQIGLHEGYNSGNPRDQVRSFIPAEKFYSDYATGAFGRNQAFKILSVKPDRAVEQKYRKTFENMGNGAAQMGIHTASVIFEYTLNNEPYKGKILGVSIDGPTSWNTDLNGFTAPASQFEAMEKIIGTITESFKTNPQWREQQNQAFAARMQNQQNQSNAQMQQMTSAHNQRMNDMNNNWNAHQQRMGNLQQSYDQQNQSWNNQQDSWDNQRKRNIDGIREEQLVRGNNGQYGKVEAGYNNYYVNPNTNQYFGTNSELQSVPENYQQWEQADYGDE